MYDLHVVRADIVFRLSKAVAVQRGPVMDHRRDAVAPAHTEQNSEWGIYSLSFPANRSDEGIARLFSLYLNKTSLGNVEAEISALPCEMVKSVPRAAFGMIDSLQSTFFLLPMVVHT